MCGTPIKNWAYYLIGTPLCNVLHCVQKYDYIEIERLTFLFRLNNFAAIDFNTCTYIISDVL